ncbi:SPARC related modular calcium binding-like protein magu isoform 2-T2 [Cochliomyia hominivorax]
MILRSVFCVVSSLCLLHVGLTANLQRQELSNSECAAKVGECDETKGRPVCGTDGQTYPTRCHLLRVQCKGHPVSIRYRGHCKACNVAREYALKHRNKNPLKFIPRCKKDGTYAPIQCISDSGCWCSDYTGTPIDNTTVRTVGRPKCREYNKGYIRRSPSRNSSGNRKRSCTQDDRATFNTNLIGLFHNEYIRIGLSMNRNHKMDTFKPTLDEAEVLNWKFNDLDENKNQMLDKNEFRELKKLVKRAVKPRRCGRAFGKFCDVDSDARLTRVEWNSCLSKDGINILSTSATVDHRPTDVEPDYAACFADRKDALNQNEENLKNGKKVGHVPLCTPDGRFQRVQCYDSICWCANEDTGEILNGTIVKNRIPQCVARAMKGCPNDVKIVFLKELKEFLKTKLIAVSNEGNTNNSQWSSEDERIAALSFVILDKNKNKAWERKEWKTFRELVTNNKNLRRCGRKMPKYCDVNNDKKVTLSEWRSCLQTQRVESNAQPDFKPPHHLLSNDSSLSKPPKLNGTNPLTIYLT